jgi:plastocyanin
MNIRLSMTLLLAALAMPVHAAEHAIDVIDHAFQPAHITIQAGDSVRWTNQGGFPHNVRADDDSFRCAEGCGMAGGGDGYGGSGPGDPSSANWSVLRQFNQPGTIPFYCEVHGAPGGIGMSGTITVLESDNEPDFAINFGLSGPWFNDGMSGQGFLVEVIPTQQPPQVFVTWFTFRPTPGGAEAQRWFSAQGTFEPPTDRVELLVLRTTGGAFGQPEPVATTTIVGNATLSFSSCTEGNFAFDMELDGEAFSASIPIVRLSPDLLCEELAAQGTARDGS